jgi:hypothetical protein
MFGPAPTPESPTIIYRRVGRSGELEEPMITPGVSVIMIDDITPIFIEELKDFR